MKTLTVKGAYRTSTYEIVTKIPQGFFVWNIGENMGTDEYIPICESAFPNLSKTDYRYYHINEETVKAIKLSREEVEALRKAAACGVINKAAAEKALKSRRTGREAERKRQRASATIDIFNRITA